MCHQVPRRLDNRNTIPADQLLGWSDELEVAQEVHVIGGEPFTLPEAIKFIRGFVAEEWKYEWARLVIATNGTVLHKHWDTIHRKQRLSVSVSLDGIGEPFERVRLGASWSDVERNILRLVDAQKTDRPDWRIKTAWLIQKSTLHNLPDFARWHTRHGLGSIFSDFISAPGVEDSFHREYFLHNPHLLVEKPEWRDYFNEAIDIFAKAGQTTEVENLTYFRNRVEKAVAASADRSESARRRRMRNDWIGLRHALSENDSADRSGTLTPTAAEGRDPVPLGLRDGMKAILRTRLGDRLTTPSLGLKTAPIGGHFRVRLHWPRFVATDKEIARRAHVKIVQQDGTELTAFRETLGFGVGIDLILSGDIPATTTALRVVVTPVGEEVSLAPLRIEIDLDPSTIEVDWPAPRQQQAQAGSSGLQRFLSMFFRSKAPVATDGRKAHLGSQLSLVHSPKRPAPLPAAPSGRAACAPRRTPSGRTAGRPRRGGRR